MQLPKPLNNNVLVEIVDPYSGVARSTENESQKKGRLVDVSVASHHLTASSAIQFADGYRESVYSELEGYIKQGAYVYWEEFANEGQGFTHDGKQYAFVAWWRLTGVEIPEAK
jgi:hypothetical protein